MVVNGNATCFFSANDPDDTEINIDFSVYKDVLTAFNKLLNACYETARKASDSDGKFQVIRNACIARANVTLHSQLKKATNICSLFEILADNNRYCNWMNVMFLKVIAIACDSEHLRSLVQNYTDVIYSRTLREVWDCIDVSVRDKYYSEIKSKIVSKDPNEMTVAELMNMKPYLAKDFALHIQGTNILAILKHF